MLSRGGRTTGLFVRSAPTICHPYCELVISPIPLALIMHPCVVLAFIGSKLLPDLKATVCDRQSFANGQFGATVHYSLRQMWDNPSRTYKFNSVGSLNKEKAAADSEQLLQDLNAYVINPRSSGPIRLFEHFLVRASHIAKLNLSVGVRGVLVKEILEIGSKTMRDIGVGSFFSSSLANLRTDQSNPTSFPFRKATMMSFFREFIDQDDAHLDPVKEIRAMVLIQQYASRFVLANDS